MSQSPELFRRHFNRALDYVRQNNLTAALDELGKSLAFDNTNPDALSLIGLCYYFMFDLKQAETMWRECLLVRPGDEQVMGYLAELSSPEHEAIVRDYSEALDLDERGDAEGALAVMRGLVDLHPDFVEPHVAHGLCAIKLGLHDEALRAFSAAHALDTGNDELKKRVIDLSLRRLDSKSATVSSGSVLRRYFTLISAVLTLALVAMLAFGGMQKGRADRIEALYNQITTELDATKSELLAKGAEVERLAIREGDLSQSVARLEAENAELLERGHYPANAITIVDEQASFNEAFALFRASQLSVALELFLGILEQGVQPNLSRESLYFTARIYEELNVPGEAINRYREYVARYEGQNYVDSSLYRLGMLFSRTGDAEQARETLSRLQDLYPESIYYNNIVRGMLGSAP